MNNSQLPDWFSPAQESTTRQPIPGTAEDPALRNRKIIKISLFIGGFLLIATAGAALLFLFAPKSTGCFTADDYAELYDGATPDSTFDPKVEFYTSSFVFEAGSTTISNEETDSSTEIDRIANFYQSHEKKPMVLSLVSPPTSPLNLAEQRLSLIKQSLIDAGIPADIISVSVLSSATTEGTDISEEMDLPDSVNLSLTSSTTCQQ